MYNRNYSDIVRYMEYRTPIELQQDKVWQIGNPGHAQIQACQHGWYYDRTMYSNTVVTEVIFYTTHLHGIRLLSIALLFVDSYSGTLFVIKATWSRSLWFCLVLEV